MIVLRQGGEIPRGGGRPTEPLVGKLDERGYGALLPLGCARGFRLCTRQLRCVNIFSQKGKVHVAAQNVKGNI